jgi:hypothetical protein
MIASLLIVLALSQPPQTQTLGAPPRTPPRDAASEKKGTGVIRGKLTKTEVAPCGASRFA